MDTGGGYVYSGGTYSGGSGTYEMQSAGGNYYPSLTGPLSGSWRWMAGSFSPTSSDIVWGIAVRIA
jgi:hypothetical protein